VSGEEEKGKNTASELKDRDWTYLRRIDNFERD